jgi:hypothetical protein
LKKISGKRAKQIWFLVLFHCGKEDIMVERSTQTVRFAQDKYNLNEVVDIVKAIIERIDHTSLTVHALDYNEDKRADNSSVCFRPEKQALSRFPHALYILSSYGLRWKPFIHTPKHRLLARPRLPPPTPCFLSRRSLHSSQRQSSQPAIVVSVVSLRGC